MWSAQWLPDHDNGFMTTEMPRQLMDITVANLMREEGDCWDLDVINDICNARDAALIKCIPIPKTMVSDLWFWIKDDKGVFTVKSCYRGLQGEFGNIYTPFWKRLWSLKFPGKVSMFLWRVCCGILPTVGALAMKRVNVDSRCPWCRTEVETEGHVLFCCGYARSVWQMSEVKELIQSVSGESALDTFVRCFSRSTQDQCSLIGMIAWSI